MQYLDLTPSYEAKNKEETLLYGDTPRLKLKFEQTSEIAVEKKEHLLLHKGNDSETQYMVGRSDQADIKIQGSSISRRQSRIIYNESHGWQVDDGDSVRKSTNGTFIWLNKTY